MRWTILDISWHIFTTHFPSLWQLPQFSLLTTRGCMNEERCAHTHAEREREQEESCFATKKRKVHVSLTLLWCNTDHSMNTHSGPRYPHLLSSPVCKVLCIAWVQVYYKKTLVSPGTTRDLWRQDRACKKEALFLCVLTHIWTDLAHCVHSVIHLSLHPLCRFA